jgi:hypothetical protein
VSLQECLLPVAPLVEAAIEACVVKSVRFPGFVSSDAYQLSKRARLSSDKQRTSGSTSGLLPPHLQSFALSLSVFLHFPFLPLPTNHPTTHTQRSLCLVDLYSICDRMNLISGFFALFDVLERLGWGAWDFVFAGECRTKSRKTKHKSFVLSLNPVIATIYSARKHVDEQIVSSLCKRQQKNARAVRLVNEKSKEKEREREREKERKDSQVKSSKRGAGDTQTSMNSSRYSQICLVCEIVDDSTDKRKKRTEAAFYLNSLHSAGTVRKVA